MKKDIIKSNTILYYRNWEENVRFYRDILGFPINFQNEWFVEFIINEGSCISVADAQKATIKSSLGSGITISFQVADVKSIWHSLDQKNISIGSINEHPWGGLAFFLHDPEGYRLEVWSS